MKWISVRGIDETWHSVPMKCGTSSSLEFKAAEKWCLNHESTGCFHYFYIGQPWKFEKSEDAMLFALHGFDSD